MYLHNEKMGPKAHKHGNTITRLQGATALVSGSEVGSVLQEISTATTTIQDESQGGSNIQNATHGCGNIYIYIYIYIYPQNPRYDWRRLDNFVLEFVMLGQSFLDMRKLEKLFGETYWTFSRLKIFRLKNRNPLAGAAESSC